jgi:DNA-binding NarL/FixJ family response regulator
VCIAEANPLLRLGLTTVLRADPDLQILSATDQINELLPRIRQLRPDLLLLDMSLVSSATIPALQDVRHMSPPIRIVALTFPGHRECIADALRVGVSGVLFKDAQPDNVLKCVHCVREGEYWMGRRAIAEILEHWREPQLGATSPIERNPFGLTARQLQITALIVAGLTNQDIAEQLAVSCGTIKHHLTRVFDKTGVSSRLALSAFASRHHLVAEDTAATRKSSDPICADECETP